MFKYVTSKLPCASVSKQDLVQNLSNENEFDLYENEPVKGNTFSHEWFCMRTRFDPGSKGNWEMVY